MGGGHLCFLARLVSGKQKKAPEEKKEMSSSEAKNETVAKEAAAASPLPVTSWHSRWLEVNGSGELLEAELDRKSIADFTERVNEIKTKSSQRAERINVLQDLSEEALQQVKMLRAENAALRKQMNTMFYAELDYVVLLESILSHKCPELTTAEDRQARTKRRVYRWLAQRQSVIEYARTHGMQKLPLRLFKRILQIDVQYIDTVVQACDTLEQEPVAESKVAE